ncbi:MAG: hypothetical protein WC243_01785 [Patescibacteria group bacterium]|jgi:uncharacterized membrane protein YdjX (TVP38/TMEM64 family)
MNSKPIKYPKLTILFVVILLSVWFCCQNNDKPQLREFLTSLGYFGSFLGGFFYAYSFTATLATAVLLALGLEQNIYLSTLTGGLGALISDILLFLFVRFSFSEEIKFLKQEKFFRLVTRKSRAWLGTLYNYPMFVIAGVLIASPLPTEIGISLFASIKKLSLIKFIVIAFILHSLGIFVVLSIGSGSMKAIR